MAQLPPYEDSDDKALTTEDAVIVLDGASAFRPVPVPASTYADMLGRSLRDALHDDPGTDLRRALADAISTTAHALDLSPGHSPSSTVSIARKRGDQVEILALGDSPVVLPDTVISDDRIDGLNLPERAKYRERLAAGTGYDGTHRTLLAELQARQVEHRNQPGGYWIAEADPTAAHHALVSTHNRSELPWCVLTTDGAYNLLRHLDLMPWGEVAAKSGEDLSLLLHECHSWEDLKDPSGQYLPRSKRHDDKTLAVVHWND